MKRLLILSDLHTGHIGGLTHPDHIGGTLKRQQLKNWRWFESQIKSLLPFDICVLNGDAIDGDGKKNGGVEQITTNREMQAEMVLSILKHLKSLNKHKAEFWFVRGTGYHTGQAEDFENIIAKEMKGKSQPPNIHNILKLDVDNVLFHFKHKTSNTSAMTSITNGILKSSVNEMFRELLNNGSPADVYVRSHIHRHIFVKAYNRTMITTPALQSWSGYGEKECDSPPIDYGFLAADIEDGEIKQWYTKLNKSVFKSTGIFKSGY